jgi:hypothetical protein
MSRVLVVEPQKILQQAITLSLFPEHDVQLSVDFSDNAAAAARNFDLVIIDAAALREGNALSAPLLAMLPNWKVPTIWIQDGGAPPAPSGGRVVVLTRPLQKHDLQLAVVECLTTAATAKPNRTGVSDKGSPVPSKATTDETRTARPSELPDSRVIELVDVVEEESERETNKTRQRKTK